ncbi:hypothetical protein ABN764_10780 [Paenibacillaceae sp. P-4]|uniref:hypothetical protein n=1 Tax=Paenibacillaceae bacterium P-4 TaxID=3160969 RepID=UPI00158015BA
MTVELHERENLAEKRTVDITDIMLQLGIFRARWECAASHSVVQIAQEEYHDE